MNIEKAIKALEKNGYKVSFFESAEGAAQYLDGEIRGKTVGFGDSETLLQMRMYERLALNNTVFDPMHRPEDQSFIEAGKNCLTTEIFLTSVNAISETGELINIDGTGNRLSGSLFGHQKVYFVAGTNKISPSLEEAINRARNIAAPLNAKRHGFKTPCAAKGERCFDCASPERICNALLIHFKKMLSIEMEVVLIGDNLGL